MRIWSTSSFASVKTAMVALFAAAFPVFAGGLPADPGASKLGHLKSLPGAGKVDLRLLEIAGKAAPDKGGLLAAFSQIPVQKTADGLVLEVVAPDYDVAFPKQVAALGAGILHEAPEYGRLTVEVSETSVLHALAALDQVLLIRPTYPPVTNSGSVNGRGAEAHRVSPSIVEAFGVDGSGVLVGIISDSFAMTDDVRGPETEVAAANTTQLTYTIPQDGEYTFVVQAGQASRIGLQWSASAGLLPLAEADPANPAACRTRISLAGVSGSQTVQTLDFSTRQDLESFIGGSCAPGEATHFVLFGFQASEGTEVTFTSRSDSDVYLSARADCSARFLEECAEPEIEPGLPVLTGTRNQESGDLPPTVFLLQEGDPSFASDEGAAMAELVHDIAPGAAIAFHSSGISEGAMAQAVTRLSEIEDFDAKVLVDDIIFLREPFYQPGIIQRAIESAVEEEKVSYFSATGNMGDFGTRQVYSPVSGGAPNEASPPNGADLHRWPSGSGYLPITFPPGEGIEIYVQWNQPWQTLASNPAAQGSQVDLDVYLLRSPNQAGFTEAFTFQALVEGRRSRDIQGRPGAPFGDPIEIVSYTNTTSDYETLYLAVNMYAGVKGYIPQAPRPLEFHVQFFGTTITFAESQGIVIPGINDLSSFDMRGPSTYGHANSPHVSSVGAVFYLDTPEFDTTIGPTDEIDMEPYSSRVGLVHYHFDTFSNALAEPRSVFKPNLSAVAGNSTTFFGFQDADLDGNPNFFGTSAAAPNAAAVAALLLNLNRNLAPGQVYTALEETAVDVVGHRAAPGRDPVSGAGLIDGLAALLYVEDNYGRTTGAESPKRLNYSAGLATDGWSFFSPEDFATPGSSSSANSLDLAAADNMNTFGWWESPEIIASPVTLSGGATTIRANPGDQDTIRISADIYSDTATPTETPGVRFRVLSSSFERNTELSLTSVADGALIASAGDPRRYRHYAHLPPGDSRFRFYFDVFAFDGTDLPGATVSLRNVEMVAFNTAESLTGTVPQFITFFSNNSRGWTRGGATDLAPVEGGVTGAGLSLGPATDPAAINFGHWTSPEGTPLLIMERGYVYRAVFRFSSNLPADQRRATPVFRARVNDGSFQFGALVGTDARTATAPVPAGGSTHDYILHWEVPPALDGKPARFSFDYVYIPEDDKDPGAILTLETLRVDRLRPPEFVGD